MSDPILYNTQIVKDEHDYDSPRARRVLAYGWDADTLSKVRMAANAAGRLQVDVVSSPESYASTTPTIYNVTMTSANTEYSQVLPDGCDKYTIQCRGSYDMRLAFVTGKVATPVEPYLTIKTCMNYYEDGLKLTGKTLYFACATAGQVAEIICWT